jgi:hypothetical protein
VQTIFMDGIDDLLLLTAEMKPSRPVRGQIPLPVIHRKSTHDNPRVNFVDNAC